MPFSSGPRVSRSVLAILSIVTLSYLYLCARSFYASELSASEDSAKQVRARILEPQNAVYWRRLGETRLYRETDPQASLLALHRAIELNPRTADAWIDTAYALQVLDRSDEERKAIANALDAEPRHLEIIWEAANLYAVLGDRGAMMQQVCILVSHDRARSGEAAELALRAFPTMAQLDCSLQEVAH